VFKSLLNERLEELTQGFELYRLMTSIDNKDLQSEVIKLARSLSSGEIPPSLAEFRTKNLVKKIRISLWGSDYRPNKQALLDWWNSGTGKKWYEDNVEAADRDVVIERHFLLSRDEVVNADGSWDSDVLKLLQAQVQDKIDVQVVWVEEVTKHGRKPTKDVLKDFAILDGEEVSASTGYETKMYRYPSDAVQYYIEVFEEQREFSYKLQDILLKSREDTSDSVNREC
jgi:hypothetical protein